MLLAEVVAHYFPKLVELHNYRWGVRVCLPACCLPCLPCPRSLCAAPRRRHCQAGKKRQGVVAAVKARLSLRTLSIMLCVCVLPLRPPLAHPSHCNSAANGLQQKLYNWDTLNTKVLRKLGMQLTKQHMADIANGAPGAIERGLKLLRLKLSGATDESIAAAGSPTHKAAPRGGALAPGALQADGGWQAAGFGSGKVRACVR